MQQFGVLENLSPCVAAFGFGKTIGPVDSFPNFGKTIRPTAQLVVSLNGQPSGQTTASKGSCNWSNYSSAAIRQLVLKQPTAYSKS